MYGIFTVHVPSVALIAHIACLEVEGKGYEHLVLLYISPFINSDFIKLKAGKLYEEN
jgi:hypothetical protein